MNCPKCNEPQIPAGKFVVTPELKIKERVKFFFFWIEINVRLVVQYCPDCGFLAVRNVQVG